MEETAAQARKLPVARGPAGTFTIAVGRWPVMLASLLLAVAGNDAESRLSEDLALARRLATVLGEGAEARAALARTLLEPPGGSPAVLCVEVELSGWRRMRAQMLIRAAEAAGSAASIMLGVPAGQLRRELRRARRRIPRRDWRGAAS